MTWHCAVLRSYRIISYQFTARRLLSLLHAKSYFSVNILWSTFFFLFLRVLRMLTWLVFVSCRTQVLKLCKHCYIYRFQCLLTNQVLVQQVVEVFAFSPPTFPTFPEIFPNPCQVSCPNPEIMYSLNNDNIIIILIN